jgi:hypothetical protein
MIKNQDGKVFARIHDRLGLARYERQFTRGDVPLACKRGAKPGARRRLIFIIHAFVLPGYK